MVFCSLNELFSKTNRKLSKMKFLDFLRKRNKVDECGADVNNLSIDTEKLKKLSETYKNAIAQDKLEEFDLEKRIATILATQFWMGTQNPLAFTKEEYINKTLINWIPARTWSYSFNQKSGVKKWKSILAIYPKNCQSMDFLKYWLSEKKCLG